MRIHVLGGGLQAMSAALALAHARLGEIRVFADDPEPNPAGIELPPNATRILNALGLRDALTDIAIAPMSELQRAARTGYLLAHRPLGPFAADRYGAPHLVVESRALEEVLHAELARASVTFAGSSADDWQDADVVIIANGPESAERACVDDAVSTRPTPWQMVTGESALHSPTITSWLAPGAWLRQVPVGKGTSTMMIRTRTELPARFASLGEIPAHDRWQPLTETLPLRSWHRDRFVLLGCAAHPLLPFAAQSLALALEDAWVLARMLDNYGDHLPTATSEYQRYRLPRATRMQRHAQALGIASLESRWPRIVRRNLRLSLAYWFLPELALQREDWQFEYDCIKGFD